MKTATMTFRGIAPYSQSRNYELDFPKKDKESAKDYEARTWRGRLHVNDDGNVFIPQMSIKNCLSEAAKYLSIQIPGKGKATYTKHFDAGMLVLEPIALPIKAESVESEWLFVPSDGKPGGGSRVWKCFPVIHDWGGTAVVYVLDDTVTQEVFEHHAREAGRFIGLGRFRPRNRGFYGRFNVTKIEWSEE